MSFKSRILAMSCLALMSCQDEPTVNVHDITATQRQLNLDQMLAQNNVGSKNENLVQGIEALREKDFDTASRLFNTALLDDPKNSAIHTLNAFTYHLKSYDNDPGALTLSESGYSQAKKFDPNNIFAILELGRIKAEQGNLVGAQDEFAEVLIIDQNNPEALYELANASYLLADIKTALMAVDRLIKINPKPARNLRAAALIYAASGKPKMAQQFLDEYLKVEKNTKQRNYTVKRVHEWHQLFKDGKMTVARADGPNFDLPMSQNNPNLSPNKKQLGPGPASEISPDTKAKIDQSVGLHPTEEMVVVDAVVLRVSEEGKTTKGNNILDGFTLTVSPYNKAYAKNAGSGISNFNISSGGSVSGKQPTVNGNAKIFAQGISLGSITYSLKIANVEKSYIEVIGRPTLVAIKSKPAEFFSGTDVKLAISGNYGGNVASAPFGNTLKVTLVEISDGYATLDVDLEGSLLLDSLPANPSSQSLVYQVGRSQIKTSVKVKVGETIMLGGTSERVESNDITGFPLLKDIPIIQYFFSRETTDSNRKSIMYLMTIRGYKNDKMRTIKYFNEGEDDLARPNLSELENRYKSWFDPQSNNIVILKSLAPLYRDFRVGDFVKLRWDFGADQDDRLEESLEQLVEFLWY